MAALDAWREQDTARELAFTALIATDVMQTRWFLQRDGFHENNPLLGRNPSAARLYASAAGGLLLHAAVARVLPHRARTVFQHVSMLIDAGFIGGNIELTGGLHLAF